MAEYYFISQLPSLDSIGENAPIPITEERFLELCSRFLKEKALREIQRLTLLPPINPEKSTFPLVEAWNAGERDLRLALAKVRADKMNKSFDLQNKSLPHDLLKVASIAVDVDSPLEAENFLLQYRLSLLESLRPMDTFSEDFVFYYGLKLKLLSRTRQFDTPSGEAAYKNIYNSILHGDELEAKQ